MNISYTIKMENYSDINKRLKSIKDKYLSIYEEEGQNVSSQIQNFVNNFEKIEKQPKEEHTLANYDNIQYKKFCMKRLNFEKNGFAQQMMMTKCNSPQNNIFILKNNGYSYKLNYSFLEKNIKNLEFEKLTAKNNLKNIRSKKVEKKNEINEKINDKHDKKIKNDVIKFITNKEDNNINNNNQNLNNSNIKYNPIFIINNETQNITKKGRRATKNNSKVHLASDYDNILTKVQVHFLSFIINFMNDILRTFIPNINKDSLFKNIDYRIKKTINHASIKKIQTKNILEILRFDISPKYKLFHKSTNSIIADKICEKLPFMEEILKKNYLDFFNEYYYAPSDKNYCIDGRTIKVTEKTEIFSELLKRNLSYKDRIKNVIMYYFNCDYKRIRSKNFDIKKIGNNS